MWLDDCLFFNSHLVECQYSHRCEDDGDHNTHFSLWIRFNPQEREMIKHFLVLFLLSSCARVGYLTEQGIGQMKLQWGGIKNEKLLNDPDISEQTKHKVRLVEDYKKFFYNYFNTKPSEIYSKTTLLDFDAVTYLVIASPHTEIKAHEFEFPFMGSFPYIGFFNESSAKKFAKKLRKKENLVTWVRPVYAYSTLGYFEDRILSSFFHYTDVELAELIFHELFHTVFFVKDEVELNENLANYFGKELTKEYFKDRPELKNYQETLKKQELVDKRFLELLDILHLEFKKLGGFITDKTADELTHRFVDEILKPDIKRLCKEIKIDEKNCEMKGEYNQARFAAFLTYEESQDEIANLVENSSMNLKDLLVLFQSEYKKYQKTNKKINFSEHIQTKVFK